MKKFLFSIFIFFSLIILSNSYVFASCGNGKENDPTCPDKMQKGIQIDKKAEDKFEVTTEDARGLSNFPITYDSTKQTFVVTTPRGEREIKATPKKAIEIAYITGMMNEFEIVDGMKNVVLIEKDGKVFYEVRGHKTGKIFGLWPVSYDVKATIDDQGKLASFEKPFVLKFLKYVLK